MGPLMLVIDIAALVTTGVVAGQTITIEVLQEQIRTKIKNHQKEFDALKDIKVYLQSLIRENDIDTENSLQDQVILQNVTEVQAFLQETKRHLQTMIQNYPQQLAGFIVPTDQYAKKILASCKPGNNLQQATYFSAKALNEVGVPSIVAGALQIVTVLEGVDWKQLGKLLLSPTLIVVQLGVGIFTLKSFFAAEQIISKGVVFGSILSAIGLAFNLYSIVDDAKQIHTLLEKKDQINKQLALLPKTQIDAMNVVKGSLSSFLAYLVAVGNLMTRIKSKFEFITIFSSDKQVQQHFRQVLTTVPNPHSLISLQTIRKINKYAYQLQDLYKDGINKENAKQKIISTDQIFGNFFKQINVNQLHQNITNAFNLVRGDLIAANKQFQNMKKVTQFLQNVTRIFEMYYEKTDEKLAFLIQQNYRNTFLKDDFNDKDKLIIVKCVSSFRQKFYGDNLSGQTYLGLKLSDYRNNSAHYYNIQDISINQEDITQYEKDWVNQFQGQIVRELSKKFQNQVIFQYYKSTLNFNGIGKLCEVRLQVNKSMFFKGYYHLYRVDCGLESNPTFQISIYTDENKDDIEVPVISTLHAGSRIVQGQRLTSQNSSNIAILHRNGNIVLQRVSVFFSDLLWQSNSMHDDSQYELCMQLDGNLCLYDKKGSVIWASNTSSPKNQKYHLVVQNSGHLVIYNQNNQKMWSS